MQKGRQNGSILVFFIVDKYPSQFSSKKKEGLNHEKRYHQTSLILITNKINLQHGCFKIQ